MAQVDVVITCYQYARYLRDCVSSVLAQDLRDIRVLIIDNASTDGSADIARALGKEDSRVSVVAREKNLGRHASLNEGIDWAESKYFMLLDADDLLAPGALRRAAVVMDQNPDVSFAYGTEHNMSFGPDVIPSIPDQSSLAVWEILAGKKYISDLCDGVLRYIAPTTVIRRTSSQKAVGHHRTDLGYTDDLEMFLRLATVGGVARTNAIQGIRRTHPQQLSTDLAGAMIHKYEEDEAAFDSFFVHEGATLDNVHDLRRRAKHTLSNRAYWSGISHARRGRLKESWELLHFAVARRPISAVVPPVYELFQTDRLFKKSKT
ncbi:MAG: glycosyltransferase family A protein [Hyphomicrobium sp.]|uniref:glycosyltransferase family A protein n=1 Tax=Hyphomicrobium sp. TaxID=82 RepID=UPI0039E3ADE5